MKASRAVEISIITPNTAAVRGNRIAWLLEQAGVPRQFDAGQDCWTTSRRSVDRLAAYLKMRGRPYVVIEALL
jgi:hypothetical protein